MNLKETIDDLRSLTAPLDPAAPGRITGEQLLATAPSAHHVMALGEAGIDNESAAAAPSAKRRRSWTRRRVLRWSAPGVLIALAGGAIAAANVLGSSPASVANEVRCYAVQQLTDDPHRYTDTSQAAAAGQGAAPDESATVSRAVDACSALWQIGTIQPGTAAADAGDGGDHTVPALAACVLSNGEAAVFPGDATTCARLDLRKLTDRK